MATMPKLSEVQAHFNITQEEANEIAQQSRRFMLPVCKSAAFTPFMDLPVSSDLKGKMLAAMLIGYLIGMKHREENQS